MKKSLLLGAALSLCLIAGAQERNYSQVYKAIERPADNGRNNAEMISNMNGGDNFGGLSNRSGDILKTQISTSSNVYGIFSLDQTVLTTQTEANMVAFGNRAGGAMGATGNDLRVAYSTDLGANWNNFVITPGVANKNFRYPSVATYNPAGNTDPANMYAVFSGPYTGASTWEGQFFGSVKFDGTTDKHITFEPNEANVYLNHMNIGLNVDHNGNVHVASQRLNGTEASYTSVGWEVLNGTFNASTKQVDWDLPRVKVQPVLLEEGRIDASSFVFSPDGSVGYLLGTAVDADEQYNPYGIEWPVVYKTTDNGATWEKTEPFDFSEIGIFNEMLYPLRADFETVVPRWYNKYVGGNRNNGAVVDKNGNLHISGIVLGTYSVDPDSLSNFYSEQPFLVFDVFMNGDGTWNAQFVDTLRTDPVDDAGTPFGMGWDQRVQMSRTDDGSKIFVSWADTDPSLLGGDITTNLQPDIYTWSYDIDNHMYTAAVNNTVMGDYWGDNIWLHTSNTVLQSGTDYFIPMTTSASTTTGGTMDNPMSHYYVGGIGFNEADYTIQEVKTIDPISNASVSQNYPNPFSTSTQIAITLNKKANVSVEVYNLVGQRVAGINAQTLEAGNHTLTLNANSLKSGIYTYSVIANGERITRKMTIK
jgi:hypothetical protein